MWRGRPQRLLLAVLCLAATVRPATTGRRGLAQRGGVAFAAPAGRAPHGRAGAAGGATGFPPHSASRQQCVGLPAPWAAGPRGEHPARLGAGGPPRGPPLWLAAGADARGPQPPRGADRRAQRPSRGLSGAGGARQLQQQLRSAQDLGDLLTLVETCHPAAHPNHGGQCMTWREAAVAMNQIRMLSRGAGERPRPVITAAARNSSATHRPRPSTGTARQERAQHAIVALSALIADELSAAADAAGLQQPQQAAASIGAEGHDGKLLALALSAAEAYNGTLPLLRAASALLSQDAVLAVLFCRPGSADRQPQPRGAPVLSDRGRGRQVEVGALVTAMGVLSRHGRGSLTSARLLAQLDELVLQISPGVCVCVCTCVRVYLCIYVCMYVCV